MKLEADAKHQQNDSDFRQIAEHIALLNPAQEGRAEDDPDKELAEYGGLSDLFAQVSCDFDCDQNKGDLQQKMELTQFFQIDELLDQVHQLPPLRPMSPLL